LIKVTGYQLKTQNIKRETQNLTAIRQARKIE